MKHLNCHLRLFLYILFICALIVGCDSTKPATSSGAESSRDVVLGTKPKVLYLASSDFINLGEKNKLVFQFRFLNFAQGDFSLAIYTAQDEREEEYDATPIFCEISAVSSSTELRGKNVIFGDQKLPQKRVKFIVDALKKDLSYKYVVFYPEFDDANRHIFYNIEAVRELTDIKDKANSAAILARTNPSPPASTRFTSQK